MPIYSADNHYMDNSSETILESEGLLEPEFYGGLAYKFKKLIGINDFSFQFRKNHNTLRTYRL